MNKILVVGGAGYIGGAISNRSDIEITVYDSLVYENEYRKNVNFIYGDIRSDERLKGVMSNFDTVIWLAAIVGDKACQLNPDITTELNLNRVKWLCENFNGKIVFASTCSVYGAYQGEDLLTEESLTNPLSLYAQTKLEAEKFVLDHSDKNVILRLGTIYGVSDEYSRIRFDLVVNSMVKDAFLFKRLSVYGGEQYRPIIHVHEVADYFIMSAISQIEGGIYIVNRKNIKILDLAVSIIEILENSCGLKNLNLDITDLPFQDIRNYKVSNNKIETALDRYFNIQSKRGIDVHHKYLKTGVEEIFKLVSTKRIKDPSNIRYYNDKALMR